MQRSEGRARLGCRPDATALPDVIHFCAPCLFTDEVEILRHRNVSITGMSSASRALGSTLRLIFPFPFFAVTTQSRTEGRDQPSSEGAAMGWLTGWRPGVLVSVQLRKSAGNPPKCLLVDNTGGGGKPRTAVREGLLLRGSNHSVLGTVRPSPAGWVPDEGGRKGRHPPKDGVAGGPPLLGTSTCLHTCFLFTHLPTTLKEQMLKWTTPAGENSGRLYPFCIYYPEKSGSHSKCCAVLKSCGTLCCPTDCSLPGFSIHGDSPGNNTVSGLSCPPPGDLPNAGVEPRFPTLWADSLLPEPPGKAKNTGGG